MPEEIKQEVIVKTQKYLGKFVKRPVLSDKLLRKPPFRFLHDIINTVIKETGFLKGLYSDAELNSDNVKERDAKVAFLSKLIDAVVSISKTELAVRPSKIVAGLEPTETNLLLQTIGKAIDKKLDSSDYVNKINSGQIVNDNKTKKVKKSDKSDEKKKTIKTTPKEEQKTIPKTKDKISVTPKSTDREKTKPKQTTKVPVRSKQDNEENKKKDKIKKKEKTKEKVIENLDPPVPSLDVEIENIKNTQISEIIETPIELNNVQSEEPTTTEMPVEIPKPEETELVTENETRLKRNTSALRPKSARPKSGDLKEKNENIEPVPLQSRPKTSLRPPSVRPSSARPGAPRLRPESAFPLQEIVPMGKINVIVENVDKDDEEETVVIQSSPESVEEHAEVVDSSAGNKGALVEEILKQIGDSDNKNEEDSDWQKDVMFGKDTTIKETSNLRTLIQSLTKTANPLGKLLNYLHEDIDAMHAELETWTNMKRQLFDEIAKQKKLTSEMNKPLVVQFDLLNQEIKKVEDELTLARNNIFRNEAKIKKLLPN